MSVHTESTPAEPVSDLHLEQLRLGELPPARAQALRQKIAERPDLQRRLEALEASDTETLATHPPHLVAARINARLAQTEAPVRRGLNGSLWTALGAMTALTLALVVIWPAHRGADLSDFSTWGERAKGDPRLFFHRNTPEGTAMLNVEDSVSEGDVLQVSYHAAGRSHGVIVSIDGRGVASLHFPSTPDGSTALETHQQGRSVVSLPHSYELDDAPRYERFFFVTSADPIDVEEILSRAEALARQADAHQATLPLPEGMTQHTSTLEKHP
ncbi:MAG: hypothetical protein ACE366_29700 [Bradymonadia bacterium]